MVHREYEAFDPVQVQREDVPHGIQSASEWAWDGCRENSGRKGKNNGNGRSADSGGKRRERTAARTQQSGGCADSRPVQRPGCAGVQRSAQPAPQQVEIYEEEGVYIMGGGAPPLVYEQPQIPPPATVPAGEFGSPIVVPAGVPRVYIDDDLGVPAAGYAVPRYESPAPGPGLLQGDFDRYDGPPSGPGLLQYELPPPGPGLLQGYFNRYEAPPSGPGLLQYETPRPGPGLLQGYFNQGDAPPSGPWLLQGYGSELDDE